ncbi:hypothetical protein [Leptolyngbya sp. FACHB-261]|uniref:hypothetical protein n=1 Tax=Leptolyngbya sp. FACHB-261 TaxID=2692806 RepID=UPI0016833A06|nr:hypothetical protein [Leptolyngbya sp. FACHB-261]MBD2102338.1 hypothetical protein [Leptolyngbya sp. FACHB-261]
MNTIGGLLGLHGLLTAAIAINHYKRTKHGKGLLIVELICACLLIFACVLILKTMGLDYQSPLPFFFGWWLAVIATLPLNITAVVKLIRAFRNKQRRTLNVLRLLLNFFALAIYLILALWLTSMILIMLSGGTY